MRELGALWTNRNLVSSLARQDLRRVQAGTAAGLAWTVLTTLVPLLIFTAVFAFGLSPSERSSLRPRLCGGLCAMGADVRVGRRRRGIDRRARRNLVKHVMVRAALTISILLSCTAVLAGTITVTNANDASQRRRAQSCRSRRRAGP